MKELHIHEYNRVDEIKMLKRLELLIGKIMTTVNELADKLTAVNNQLNKAKEEIVSQVQALQDALQNVELPVAAQEALAALESTAQMLDDLNDDAPVEEPEQPVEEPQAG
ncbi:MAG: hypothetical protein KIT80_23430 [Chitinophagaceae bacterium]|nr:hypothetical protein [Chitinophagaceae bacterium]